MKPLLLDTQLLLWWLLDTPDLSSNARSAIANGERRVLVRNRPRCGTRPDTSARSE